MTTLFPTYVAWPGSSTSVDWEACVELEGSPDDSALRDLEFVLDRFWHVTARGAFVAPGVHPAQASLQATARAAKALNARCWDLQTVNVDARFTQVLRNTLAGFSFTTWPVTGIRLAARQAGVQRPLQALSPLAGEWSLNMDRYPPPYARVKFPIVSRLREVDAPRRYEIEFSGVLTSEQAEQIARSLASWGEVGLGGFAETEAELIDGACAILNVSVHQLDDSTIELTADRFGGGTPARNALVNLLCHADRTVAAIRRVGEEQ